MTATVASPAAPAEAVLAVESPTRRALRRLAQRKGAMVALVVILVLVALALLAPMISPYDPARQSWSAVRKAPSALNWFGTDEVGRDILTRILYGARASLSAGVISVAIAIAIGVLGSVELAVPAAVYGVLMFPAATLVGWAVTRSARSRERVGV